MADPNTYEQLEAKLKLKRSQPIKNKASYDLYNALMRTEKDSVKMKDVLIPNSRNLLSEQDKERIFYVLDYLNIMWVKATEFAKLTSDDFSKIKEQATPKARAEMLISLIIQRSWKDASKSDILEHADAMVAWKNAEIGKRSAEEMALKRLSVNRFRYFWAKISKVLDDNKQNISKCYMDIIKYANYSSLNLLRRTGTRYVVPTKFWWRDIPKQTQRTLTALRERIKSSDNPAEIYAIEYIRDNLQKAFDYYKGTIWPSDAEFDTARLENESRIYSEKKKKKKNKKKK